jgi:hypothetical protein
MGGVAGLGLATCWGGLFPLDNPTIADMLKAVID